MKKIAYLFALGLTLTACSSKKQQMMGADNNEFAVETVETGAADLSTTYPATIRGVQDVEIRAKVSGNIVRQLVDEGDFVKAGQVLFVIDPTQYKAAERSNSRSTTSARCDKKKSFRSMTWMWPRISCKHSAVNSNKPRRHSPTPTISSHSARFAPPARV